MPADGIPRRTLAGLILGTLVVGGGLAAAVALLFRTTDRDPREVVTAAQRVLRDRFPQAAEIRFAPAEDTHLESKGDDRYLVTGWMEVTDEEGGKATFDFSCLMLTIPGGIWVSERVEVAPRP
jgi:hypothetical protein